MLADAAFGLRGCRWLSALMTGLTAWLAYLVAVRITRDRPEARRFAWLAPALVWLQPLVATLAQTTLTETPAALYLTASIWLWLRSRRALATAVLSLLFVTRYETLAFLPVVGLALLVAHAREAGSAIAALGRPALWAEKLLLLWAPAAYVGAALVLGISEDASPLGLFSQPHSSDYGSGTWHHMAVRWLIGSGAGVLALAAAAAARLGRRALVPAAAAMGLVALHTVLFRFGLFASGGYERFLVPACGAVAALAAAGVGVLLEGRSRAPVAVALLLLAAMPLALLEHDVPAAARAGGLVAAAVLAIAAGIALVAPGRALARGTGVLALVLVVLQAALLIRPLTIDEDPPDLEIPLGAAASTARLTWSPALLVRPLCPRSLLENSVLWRCVVAAPPGVPILANDTFVRCYRPEAVTVRDVPRSIDLWSEARPGTVFIHVRVRGTEEVRPLLGALDRLGTRLAEHAAGPFVAVAYERGGS
jgi:hypothetical protein